MSRSYLRNVFQTFTASFKHLRVHLSSSIKRTRIDLRYFRATRFKRIHQPSRYRASRVCASHPFRRTIHPSFSSLKNWFRRLLSDNKTDSRSLVPRAIDFSTPDLTYAFIPLSIPFRPLSFWRESNQSIVMMLVIGGSFSLADIFHRVIKYNLCEIAPSTVQIVRNEILTCPCPERVTHVLAHAPKCEVPCVHASYSFPLAHPSLTVHRT